MTTPRLAPALRRLFVLLAAYAAFSCTTGGGISGSSLVFGRIEGFGSIIVGGIAFDIDNAQVSIEGNAAEVEDLQLGMVVAVRGNVSNDGATGVADRVAADHLLEGPVEGVNATDGTFVSLSQLVITDPTTVLDGVDLDTLAAGDNVEVFGFRDADGSIRATRVESKGLLDEFELTGIVSDLDEAATTFRIGLLLVDYSGAEIEDTEGLGLANGSLVESESEVPPENDLMISVGVEILDPAFAADDEVDIVLEGVVSTSLLGGEFEINGFQRILITPDTIFEGGEPADLIENALVEVEGALDGDGAFVATEVEIVTQAG